MATKIKDVERYYLLRARQAGFMAAAIDEFEFFKDVIVDETDAMQVYFFLFNWIEAKTSADEILLRKDYQCAVFQIYGHFEDD